MVGRNAIYGIRFRESFQSDEAWMAINQFGRPPAHALVPGRWIAVGAVAFFVPLQRHPIVTVLFDVAPLIFVFIPVYESWRFAKRYGSER